MAIMARAANATLIALIVTYFLLVGADLFGQAVLVPFWFAEPPRSLLMFNGPVEYDSAWFWKTLTNLVIVFSLLALITNWASSRRWWLVGFIVAFIAINAISFAFIFPEFNQIAASPYSDTVDPELQAQAAAWHTRAMIRTFAAGAIGILPLIALARPR